MVGFKISEPIKSIPPKGKSSKSLTQEGAAQKSISSRERRAAMHDVFLSFLDIQDKFL